MDSDFILLIGHGDSPAREPSVQFTASPLERLHRKVEKALSGRRRVVDLEVTVGNRPPFIFEPDSQNNKPVFGARPHISKRAFRRPKPRAWKVELEYLPMVHSAARHYVSAFLTKPEPVSKTASAKLKHI